VNDEVAPDGSPVAVYLAIPAAHGFEAILPTFAPGTSVLDLGCGVGRLSNLLAGRGCEVTGVDESAAMLAHLETGVTPVHARIDGLALGRRFGTVVLASHLVNTANQGLRRRLLRAAAAHVAADGRVLVEHHHPATVEAAPERTGAIGPVEVTFVVHRRRRDLLDAEVRYRLDGRTWTQRFTTRVLDLPGLERELASVGLGDVRALTSTWLEAAPVAAGATFR
jgi:SAM-dependent methyltransferase